MCRPEKQNSGAASLMGLLRPFMQGHGGRARIFACTPMLGLFGLAIVFAAQCFAKGPPRMEGDLIIHCELGELCARIFSVCEQLQRFTSIAASATRQLLKKLPHFRPNRQVSVKHLE